MQGFIKSFLLWDIKYTAKFKISENPKWRWFLATFLAHSGDSWYCLGGLFIIWLLRSGEWHRISAALGSGTFLLAFIIIILKFSIKEEDRKVNGVIFIEILIPIRSHPAMQPVFFFLHRWPGGLRQSGLLFF